MRCARPPTPRASRTRMRCGSRWSPRTADPSALVAQPPYRSAGKAVGHLRIGVDAVSKHRRSFLLALLLPAVLLVSVFAVVQAQEGRAPAVKQTRWSDAATWPGRKVPKAGDKVTIAAGQDVVLDVSPPALGGLTIAGKLSFANNKDLELTTEWV